MIETAPAGWYGLPGGGSRFWDGRMWTPDVLGAPSHTAEYEALSPDLPPPQTLVIEPLPPQVPAGWYPNASGALQWFDGTAWGPLAPDAMSGRRPPKEAGIAYAFLLVLGGFAAHRFYLGLTGSAIAFNIIWWGGWMLSPILIGIPFVIAGGVWLFIDLFRIPFLTRSVNALRGYYR